MNSDNYSTQIHYTQGDEEKIRTPEMKQETPRNITENGNSNSEIHVRAQKRKSMESDDGPKMKIKRFCSDRYDFRHHRYTSNDKQQNIDLSNVNANNNFHGSCDSVNFNSDIVKNIPPITTPSYSNNSQSDSPKDIEEVNEIAFQNDSSDLSNEVENENNSNYLFRPLNLVQSPTFNLFRPPEIDEILGRIKPVEENDITNNREQVVFFASTSVAPSYNEYNLGSYLGQKPTLQLSADASSLPTEILNNGFGDRFESNFENQTDHHGDTLNTGHIKDTSKSDSSANNNLETGAVTDQPNLSIYQNNNSVNENENYNDDEKDEGDQVDEGNEVDEGDQVDEGVEVDDGDEVDEEDEEYDEEEEEDEEHEEHVLFAQLRRYVPENRNDELLARILQAEAYAGLYAEDDDDEEFTDEEIDNMINRPYRVPRGLDIREIELFPTRNFNISNNENLNGKELEEKLQTQCKVCLGPFEINDILRGLPCFHEYHRTCIDTWLKKTGTCPFCRCSVFASLR